MKTDYSILVVGDVILDEKHAERVHPETEEAYDAEVNDAGASELEVQEGRQGDEHHDR